MVPDFPLPVLFLIFGIRKRMTHLCTKDICILLCGSIVKSCMEIKYGRKVCVRSRKDGLCWLLTVPQPHARSTACSVIVLLDC